MAADHPLHADFARLTRLEEAKGLYADPARIGTRDGWEAVLAAKGLRLSGHRLVPVVGPPPQKDRMGPGRRAFPDFFFLFSSSRCRCRRLSGLDGSWWLPHDRRTRWWGLGLAGR